MIKSPSLLKWHSNISRKLIWVLTLPFYPILFFANYSLLKNISFSSMFLISICLIFVFSITFFGINYFLNDYYRSAYLSILIHGWCLYYGAAAQIIQNILNIKFTLTIHFVFLFFWTLIIIFAGSRSFWEKINPSINVTTFFNIFTIIMFLIAGYRLISAELHSYIRETGQSARGGINSNTNYLPDIYYIILDGYGRTDVLEERYSYDNSDFIDWLSSRGFYVASQSRSNYVETSLSLISSLNMSYIDVLPRSLIRTPIIKRLISESNVRSVLDSQGYQFVTLSSPIYFTDIADSDLYLSRTNHLTSSSFLESQLLQGSLATIGVAAGIISPNGATYRDEQERILYSFDQLENLPSLTGPKFVFVHILSPHPPYLFDQNGPITPDKHFIVEPFGDSKEISESYIGQLIFLNSRVEKMIDALLKNSSSPPIIIIQGDHGPGPTFRSPSIDKLCLKEKASILNAYYLPSLPSNSLYETISPVNTFRILFNQYFKMDFRLLEDKVYFSTNREYYQFIDVTEESMIPCTVP